MGRVLTITVCAMFVGIVFAGCVHESSHCGTRYTSAYWREPGLFATLSDAASSDPGERHGRLPFAHNETAALWGQDYALNMVTWISDLGDSTQGRKSNGILRLVPAGPPDGDLEYLGRYLEGTHVTMFAMASIPDTKWLAALESFVDDTGIFVQDMEAWSQSVLDTRRLPYGAADGSFPQRIGYAAVPETMALEALYDSLGEPDRERTDDIRGGSIGMRNLRSTTDDNKTWLFSFRVVVRSLPLPDPEGVDRLLEVDAGDHVRVGLPPGPGENETAHQEWITAAFRSAALFNPSFERFGMDASSC